MAEAYAKSVKIEVKRGSLLELEVDAIVNPANSMLIMGVGVAGAIKRTGGEEIEKETVKNTLLLIGKAILTSAGRLKAKNVVHAPTMEKLGPTTAGNVYKATYAALELAHSMNFRSIAIPSMGTGVRGLSPNEAAKAMFKALEDHLNEGLRVERIIFIDLSGEVVDIFKKRPLNGLQRSIEN